MSYNEIAIQELVRRQQGRLVLQQNSTIRKTEFSSPCEDKREFTARGEEDHAVEDPGWAHLTGFSLEEARRPAITCSMVRVLEPGQVSGRMILANTEWPSVTQWWAQKLQRTGLQDVSKGCSQETPMSKSTCLAFVALLSAFNHRKHLHFLLLCP